MSTVILETGTAQTDSGKNPQDLIQVQRTPCYWTSQHASLFGWLHTRQSAGNLDHAVVIAAPIGYEQLHAHRSLRSLADALAEHGLPTFRFDWHGTGDSVGRDEDPQRLATWQANLRDAVAFIRNQLPVRQVSVVGLRFGATLAVTALAESEIAQLVLWAPVVNGRTYVREMTAIDRTSEIPATHPPGMPVDLEPAGLVLTEATAQEISPVNLLQTAPLNCRTLLVSRDDFPFDSMFEAWYQAAGVPYAKTVGADYAGMMADPHKGRVPILAIQEITDWLVKGATGAELRDELPLTSLGSTEMVTEYTPEGPDATVTGPAIRERIEKLVNHPEVFGIISEPVEKLDSKRPTIVILNAGTAYRVGPGRLNLHLARRLAAEGFRCVRIDANGIGDSVADPGTPVNDSYSAMIFRDIDHVLQTMQAENPAARFVLLGLCSGAYFAFQSAAALTTPQLVESVIINPLTFFWKDGMEVTDSADHHFRVQSHYLESAANPRKWLKFFSGQTKIGVMGTLKFVSQSALHWCRSATTALRPKAPTARPRHDHPAEDHLAADLDEIAKRDRKLTMIFGRSDPGYTILMGKAGRKARQSQRMGRLTIQFIEQTDHNFSRRSARHDLVNCVTEQLQRRYQ